MDDEPDVPEVRPPTVDDVRRICRGLEEAEARYVLIGGFAVVHHGGERTTKDIDLLVDPDPANVERLKQALSVLEDNAAREIDPDDLQRYRVVRVADEVMVDLLAAACSVTWSEAAGSALLWDLDGTPVIVADVGTLTRTKEKVRPRDDTPSCSSSASGERRWTQLWLLDVARGEARPWYDPSELR